MYNLKNSYNTLIKKKKQTEPKILFNYLLI